MAAIVIYSLNQSTSGALSDTLERLQHSVFEVSTLKELQEQIKSTNIDVAFINAQNNGASGIEALKELESAEQQTSRACNTPENAIAAVTTGRTSLTRVQAGSVWSKCAPKGDYEIKGILLLDGEPVVVLHFSPEDGSLLPKGLHALSAGRPEVSVLVEKQLSMIVSEVTILEGVEFREPELCWVVPVAHKG